MKDVRYYLSLNYPKLVYQDEDGQFIVEVKDLPGCIADGATPDEAFENARGAMEAWLTSRFQAGLTIPEPRTLEYSGKTLVRMPPWLHKRLAEQAEQQEISLNQHLVTLLTDASARLDQGEFAIQAAGTGKTLGLLKSLVAATRIVEVGNRMRIPRHYPVISNAPLLICDRTWTEGLVGVEDPDQNQNPFSQKKFTNQTLMAHEA